MRPLFLLLLACSFMVASAQTTSLVPNSSDSVIVLEAAATSASQAITVPSGLDSLYVGITFERGIAVRLTDPNGVAATPSELLTDTTIYLIPKPTAGTWTLQISHDGGVERSALVEVFNNGTGAPRIGAIVRYANVQGEDVTISAALFRDNNPIVGADVKVKVSRGDGSATTTATALDNGGVANADGEANDGLYSAVLKGLPPGFYIARVEAMLPEGVSVAGSEFFAVYATTASLTGTVSDEGVDVDGDALVDRVDLSLGVDVERSGGYAAEVLLQASNGQKTWTEGGFAQLTPQSTQIVTSISADELKEKLGVNGPYKLKSVRLLWSPDGPNPIPRHIASEFQDLGRTGAYNLSELDRAYLEFTRYLGDEGVDLNGNGQFDVVRVRFELDSAIAEGYTFAYNARLVPEAGLPEDGRESFATAQQTLELGSNILTLDFPIEEYGVNGVSGPYLVTQPSLYPLRRLPSPYNGVSGDKFQNLPNVLGETQAYSVFELEGGLPGDIPSLIAFVETIAIDSPGASANALRKNLIDPLEKAQADLEDGRVKKVENRLKTFLNKVDAQAGKKIRESDAEVMRQAISFILDRL